MLSSWNGVKIVFSPVKPRTIISRRYDKRHVCWSQKKTASMNEAEALNQKKYGQERHQKYLKI